MSKTIDLISRIQAADEATKKAWLIGATSLAMLIVISVWVVYINHSIVSIDQDQSGIAAQSDNTSFATTFSAGFTILKSQIGSNVSRMIATLRSFAERKNSVSIQSASLNFVAEGIADVKPKKLPL